jgi:hypothetical protein
MNLFHADTLLRLALWYFTVKQHTQTSVDCYRKTNEGHTLTSPFRVGNVLSVQYYDRG